MGLSKLIQAAALLAVLAASTGQLPCFIKLVRAAQLELIQDSKASKWGQAMLFPTLR